MEKRSVLLANESLFLRDMLKRIIVRTPDIKLAGVVQDAENLTSILKAQPASWVVVSLTDEGKLAPKYRKMLMTGKIETLFGISNNGKVVKISRMDLKEWDYHQLTLPEMIQIFRS